MKSARAKFIIAAIAFVAPILCRADALQPGMTWVYESPRSLYVLRINENHSCHFAMVIQEPKFEDAGPCKLLTNGAEIMVDLTFDGAFANGLPVTGLRQLRVIPSADGQSLISLSHIPSVAFLRMSSAEAERLIAERK
jgi:hypothetical protein